MSERRVTLHDHLRDAARQQAPRFNEALLLYARAGCGMNTTSETTTGPDGTIHLTYTYTPAPDLPPLTVRDNGATTTYERRDTT